MAQFNVLNKFLYSKYISRCEVELKGNPKIFWNYINSKKGCSNIPTRVKFNGTSSENLADSVNFFADFFKSNYVVDSDNTNYGFCVDGPKVLDFGSLSLSEKDIINGISSLQSSLKRDIDGISSFLLKNCSHSLCSPLSYIFNISLSTGVFIDRWKLASITPIFKTGNKNEVTNYRPISKLSTCSKLFEKVVKDKLAFAIKGLIDPAQHGFVCGRSTVTNLAVFSQFCVSEFKSKSQVDTIYTDFSKAFDTVSHKILLWKLENLGFHSAFLLWLKSYLSNRTSFVEIGSTKSHTFVSTSGVPQGSILGPILFILFINDVGRCFKYSKYLLYADDLKLFRRISCLSDTLLLQEDLNALNDWALQNKLCLNTSKCYHMTFSKSMNPLSSTYHVSNVTLASVNEIRDLGVIFDSSFTFIIHSNSIIPKAYANLAFLRRYASDFKDPYTRKILYNALVRSKLEYASIIWNPMYSLHSLRIERVQRKFVRFALQPLHFDTPLPPYGARCILINVLSLEIRRLAQSLMFIYDIISGTIDCSDLLGQISFNVPNRVLRSYNPFYVEVLRSNYLNFAPLTRGLEEFNRLSRSLDLDFAMPRSLFKSLIESYYMSNKLSI